MTITSKLSEFICNMSYESMPPEVREKAKENLIDTLASAIPGVPEPDVKGVTAVLKSYDTQNDCVIWGTKLRASVQTAALINGIAGHAVEMDDFHPQAKAHMGTIVIPAALPLGEKNKISGKKLIESIIAGYETGLRIAIAIGTASHRLRGWHATATCGVFAAAAASSKIIGLDALRTTYALGLAGTQAGGLWAFMQDGAGNKKLHGGAPALDGINSALLAQGGMTGPTYILEAEDGGFFKATSDAYDLNRVTQDLGVKYDVLRVGRKPYACCRSMHLSIEGMLNLAAEHGLTADDIEKIDVHTYEIGVIQCGMFPKPQNVFEAKFSIPYGIAVALIDGAAGAKQFEEARIEDPAVQALCEKISVHIDEKYTKEYPKNWGCEMRVRTKDGRVLESLVWNGKGGPDNPMTKEDLVIKFKSLAGVILDDRQMDAVVDAVYNLENIRDINELTKLLVP